MNPIPPNDRAAKRDYRYFKRRPNRRLRIRLPFRNEFADELPPSPPGSRYFVIALRLPDDAGVMTAVTGGPACVANDLDGYSDAEIMRVAEMTAKHFPGPRKILEVLGTGRQ